MDNNTQQQVSRVISQERCEKFIGMIEKIDLSFDNEYKASRLLHIGYVQFQTFENGISDSYALLTVSMRVYQEVKSNHLKFEDACLSVQKEL